MTVAVLTEQGTRRVLEAVVGMTFVVDAFTNTADGRGRVAHVRDYRYRCHGRDFQIWSIGPDGYVLLDDEGAS